MSVNRERAFVLLEQGRPELAEHELRRALADDPGDAELHTLLALCLLDQDRTADGLAEAEAAIGLAPDDGFAHYGHARALLESDRPDEAERAAQQALDDDPWHPAYWGMLSSIHMHRRRWADALTAADRGLESDPEHMVCNNLRAAALVNLGRRDEAGATLRATLNRNPEVAYTHANQGWALLHRGHRDQALEHFREALRIEPGHDWARAGLVEAMKARNPLYGLLLRYFLWMARLDRRTQWIVMLGGLLGYRMVVRTLNAIPALSWLVLPVVVAWGSFVYLTWTAAELFNVVLLVDPVGRHALTREQKVHAGIVGAAFAVLLGFVAWLAATGGAGVPLAGAGLTALATLPLTGALHRTGGRRLVLAAAAAAVAGLGLAAWVLHAGGDPRAGELLGMAITTGVASTWLAALVPQR